MPARENLPVADPAAAPARDACATPAPATFRVAYRPSPFRLDRHLVDIPYGPTLAEVVARLIPDPDLRRYAAVGVRGEPVPAEWWPRLRVKPGQTVSLAVLPQGGGGLLRILATAVVIAAAIAVTIALPGIGGALLGAAISMGGMMAINALIPPPLPDLGGAKQKSATYSLTGASNQARPWQPVPRLFGRHRIVPALGADTFVDIQGDEQWLVCLFCWGYGPLQVDTLKIGDTPLASFDNQSTEFVDGSSLTPPTFQLYPSVAVTATFQAELTKVDGYVTRTTALQADSAVVEITFPGGMIIFSKKTGDEIHEHIFFTMQYSPVGQNTWTDTGGFDVDAKTASVVRRTFTIQFPSRGQYDVRIKRNSDDDDNGVDHLSASYWTALRSRTSDPPVSIGGVAFTSLRIKASHELSGSIQDFSGIATSVAPDWDATSGTWIARATRNPASLLRLLLQGHGAYQVYLDSEVDLAALEDWHEFCDAQDFTCDYVLDSEVTLWEAARIICAAGRASPTRASGLWSVLIDRPQTTPAALLTPRNVKGFQGSRTFVDMPHALRVQFVDGNNDFQTDERLVYADGYGDQGMVANDATLTLASKFQQWQVPGATSADQVYRLARYHLACAKLQPETYTFDCDWEWLTFQRGDLIHAMHDAPEWGTAAGRVTAVGFSGQPAAWKDGSAAAAGWTDAAGTPATWITFAGGVGTLAYLDIDETVQMDPGSSFVVQVRYAATNTAAVWPITTAAGGTTRLSIAAGTVVPPSAAPSVGDLVVVGVLGRHVTPLLVKGVSPASDLAAKVTCIPYFDAVYTADTEAIPPWDANITPPVGTAVPIITRLRSDEAALSRDADGSVHLEILVSLYDDGSRPLTSITAVQVEYRVVGSGAPFRTVTGANDATEIAIPSVTADLTYEVAARYLLDGGKAGRWCPLQQHTVSGALIPPQDVTTIYLAGDRVQWVYVAPPDFAGFRVRTTTQAGQVWDDALPVSDGLYTVDYVLLSELPDQAVEVLVKGETTAGPTVQSINAGRLAVTGVPRLKAIDLFSEDIAAEGFPSADVLAPAEVVYTNNSGQVVSYTNSNGRAVAFLSGDSVSSGGGYEVVNGGLQSIDGSAWLSPATGPWLSPPNDPWLAGAFGQFTYVFQYACPAGTLPSDRIRLDYTAEGEIFILVRWADGAVVRFADDDPMPERGVPLPPRWVPMNALPGPGASNPFVPWRNGVRPIAGDVLEFEIIGHGGGAVRPRITALKVVVEADLRTAVFGDVSIQRGGTQVVLPAGYRVVDWVHVTLQLPSSAARFGIADKHAAGGPVITGYDAAGQPVGFTGDVTVGYA
jgi:hypothetical protein